MDKDEGWLWMKQTQSQPTDRSAGNVKCSSWMYPTTIWSLSFAEQKQLTFLIWNLWDFIWRHVKCPVPLSEMIRIKKKKKPQNIVVLDFILLTWQVRLKGRGSWSCTPKKTQQQQQKKKNQPGSKEHHTMHLIQTSSCSNYLNNVQHLYRCTHWTSPIGSVGVKRNMLSKSWSDS